MDRSLNPSSSSMQNTVLSRESSSNEDDIPQIRSSKNAISTPASLIQAFVVVSLLATPIVFLPYIPLRRRLSSMTEQITTLRSLNEELLRRSSMVHAYGGRQGILLEQTRDELRKHRHLSGDRLGTISRELGAARKQLKEVQSSSDERIKGMGAEIASLKEQLAAVEEKKDGLDTLPSQVLDELSSSLVDVASFIEEMETIEGLPRRGPDPRGVERMRSLALKIHQLAHYGR